MFQTDLFNSPSITQDIYILGQFNALSPTAYICTIIKMYINIALPLCH